MKIMLNDVRLAFAQHLFEAGTVGGEGEPAFSCTAIFPADHPAVAELTALEEALAKEKWGAKAPVVLKELRAKDRGVVHNGDLKASYDGFEGNMYVSARAKTRPTVVDRDRSPVIASDGKVYSGCYANVSVEAWAMDNQYGKRINAQLLGVQFVRDGDSFGGGARPADPEDFGDLSAEGETESLLED